MDRFFLIPRRTFNQWLMLSSGLNLTTGHTATIPIIKNNLPGSSINLPAIGMGTWITFDVNHKEVDLANHVRVLHEFFKAGGQMIDSSPMYGYAQQVLGLILDQVKGHEQLFSASKVWTMGEQNGIAQMNESIKLWGLKAMDLMHIHNMLDWQTHLPTLNQLKSEGLIKFSGITTSHGRRHRDLISMLNQQPIDFVQFSYNINDREVENRLLPLAQDLGVAVVINRPFQTGGLFARVRNKPLPEWAKDIQCENWAQFFLKFVISHPAVTCAIPATSQVEHMQQNMLAMQGDLPDQYMRKEMVKYFEKVI